jgi:hypothetical protein
MFTRGQNTRHNFHLIWKTGSDNGTFAASDKEVRIGSRFTAQWRIQGSHLGILNETTVIQFEPHVSFVITLNHNHKKPLWCSMNNSWIHLFQQNMTNIKTLFLKCVFWLCIPHWISCPYTADMSYSLRKEITWRPWRWREDNIKMYLDRDRAVGYSEHGKESSVTIKGETFLDQLNDSSRRNALHWDGCESTATKPTIQ